ncbi:MAG: c-type cytochrome [Chloroflexi bacterium]|nr:c-type cytochrome [Chloroflexota bacterium]
MRRLRTLPLIPFLLLFAACGRTDISITAVATRVERPTEAAVAPTEAPADATAEVAADATTEATGEATAETGSDIVQPTTAPLGDAARGATLFTTTYTTAQGPWACNLCHNITDQRLVGPGLGGLRARFEAYEVAEPIENYVHHSVLHPNDFISPADAGGAYPPSLMPQNYAELLSAQDVDDLAAYVLSLGG